MKKNLVHIALLLALSTSFSQTGYTEETNTSFKAFLMSLAIPGLGQYKEGAPGYAKLFIAAELALLSGLYYNGMMMDASRQDYLSQAFFHTGNNPSSSGSAYLNAVGAFNSSFEHNSYKVQYSSHPILYTGNKSWQWDNEESRLKFRNLRERELEYENNKKFCVAGIILNHFLAGLNASKLAQKNNSTHTVMSVKVLDRGLGATLTRSF